MRTLGLTVALSLVLVFLLAESTSARRKVPATRIRDCSHAKSLGHSENGTYTLWINETTPVQVTCEFWNDYVYTVILRRVDSSVSFYRGWNDYVIGFGTQNGDFWLGLNHISYLTNTQHQGLTINMQDWSGHNENVNYNHFLVTDARTNYVLSVSGFSGSIPDDLSFNSGMPFATFDRPDSHQCAVHQKGGWWYNYCTHTLPTGTYYRGGKYVPSGSMADGIYWDHWLGVDYSLRFFQMVLYST